MKKIKLVLLILVLSASCLQAQSPKDSLKKVFSLNDYTLVGVEYGASASKMQFNPSKTQTYMIAPGTFGVFVMKYGKLFDGSPNFGLKAGVRYGHEGYQFKMNKETGITPTLEGAEKAISPPMEPR